MWKWLQSSLKPAVSPAPQNEPFRGIPDARRPSDALKAAVEARECVLFAGEELSRVCAMPVWQTFLAGFADWLGSARAIDAEAAEQLRELHRAGKHATVLAGLRSLVKDRPELIVQYAEQLYLKPAALSRTLDALGKIPFCAAITPNLDVLLERIFRLEPCHILTRADSAEAAGRLERKEPFLLKLRGSLAQPETCCIWMDEAIAAATADATLAAFLKEALNTRTLLIVGAGLKEIELWLGTAKLKSAPPRSHYAVIPSPGDTNALAAAKELHRRYNLHVMQHPPKDTHMAVAFIQSLVGEPEALTLADDD